MGAFLVRADLGYAYAYKNYEKEGQMFKDLATKIAGTTSSELLTYRFTFAVYKLNAVCLNAAKNTVVSAWQALFPDASSVLTVHATPDPGGDRSDLMRAIYKGYYGAAPYIDLVTDLTLQIPQLSARGGLAAIRKQNYLFAINTGCGYTTMISSLANFMMRMGVFGDESSKRTKYGEFTIGKESGGGQTSVDDFIEGLYNSEDEDRALVGIDISYFLEGKKNDELRRFARRLYPFEDKLVFVFRVPYLERKALDDIAAAISDQLPLRTVPFPPLHDIALYEAMWDNVRKYGYSSDKRLAEAFFARIRAEKKDGRFYGFKTVEKVVEEMVLTKAAEDAQKEAAGTLNPPSLILPSDLPQLAREKVEKTGYDALNELIGMEKIAGRVREIAAQVKMSIKNEKLDRPCIHMRFLGAPGTGKTTVARIIGQIFREEGILRKGAFMEYSARDLCAEYVGQTAVKTASICRDAYGSVLFIDEAYALYDNDHHTNDYGKEALTTLISEMENHRDDMLVIMAGYTDDMETLMKGNAGLRSRMPYAVTFESYTKEQLADIFMLMVRKHFEYTADLESEARAYFASLADSYVSSKEFANARFVRNLYERTWSKGALRTAMAGMNTVVLTKEDFLAASGEKEFSEKIGQKSRIGF